MLWLLWLDWVSLYTKPITIQVTVRIPRTATVIDFAAERAKRRKA
jgi:hypothetical protein